MPQMISFAEGQLDAMWWICIGPGELLQEHEVFKRYLALCTGRVEPQEGVGVSCEKVQ